MQHDLDRAAVQFEQALAIKNDFVEAECNLGAIAIEKKDFPVAEAHFLRVLKSNPHYERAKAALDFVRSQSRAAN